ncbi:Ohr family peroxiredoxin [Neisseriaceae bacterium PsAf]|nr:Ohr family peroxiredoxin [Neisseriaceae bacterium PsAf]
MPSKILYETEVTYHGGREGEVKSSDGVLNLSLSVPKAMGGKGEAKTNPEQLFAAGFAACFFSALQLVSGREKVALPDEATVTGKVGIGPEGQGFGLAVELTVYLPGIEKEKAQELADKTHQVCPYSNATRGNIPVEISVKV